LPATTIKEVIVGYGHENIRAKHRTTFEVTKDNHLSHEGDCIIAVGADKALADLGHEFKDRLRKPNAKLIISIEVDEITEKVNASGSQQLSLTHSADLIVRKSDYMCSRTLAIHADKAANDLSRELVEKLKNPKQRVKITLELGP
jgi:hypothetical protein